MSIPPNLINNLFLNQSYSLFIALVENFGDRREHMAAARMLYHPEFDEVFRGSPIRLLIRAAQAIIEKRVEHAEMILEEVKVYPNAIFDWGKLTRMLSELKAEKYFNTMKDHIIFIQSENKNGYLQNSLVNFQKFIEEYGFHGSPFLKACNSLGLSRPQFCEILNQLKAKCPNQFTVTHRLLTIG